MYEYLYSTYGGWWALRKISEYFIVSAWCNLSLSFLPRTAGGSKILAGWRSSVGQ